MRMSWRSLRRSLLPKDRDHWCAELTRLEVPNSAVRSSVEVLESDQAKALGIAVCDPRGPQGAFHTIRSPLTFNGQRMTEVTAPPTLGQHNEDIKGVLDRK